MSDKNKGVADKGPLKNSKTTDNFSRNSHIDINCVESKQNVRAN